MRLFGHKMERSADSHAILDEASRLKKAKKITAICSQYVDLKHAVVLDIGTGSGHIATELAKQSRKVFSVDIADERKLKKNYSFRQVSDEKLPFKDRTFDIVVSNHVVEHAPNQELHLQEAMRVLKAGGTLYLATPNKLWLTDPHYKLPFISWLPRNLSALYLRFVQGDVWDIYPVSYRGLSRLLRPYKVRNELPFLIRSSDNPELDTSSRMTRLLARLPRSFDGLTRFYSPTLITTVQRKYYK